MVSFEHKCGRPILLLENVNIDELIVISLKNESHRGVRLRVFKKLYKLDQSNV